MSNAKKKKKLFEGKTKALFETDNPEQLILAFKDEVGEGTGVVEHKGEINNQISTLLFRYLESHHIATHFLAEAGRDAMLVRQLNMIALSIVIHCVATGATARRLGVKDNTVLQPPLVEYYLKDESTKKTPLERKDLLSLGLLTQEELQQLVRLTAKAVVLLGSFFERRGLVLVACRLEFGRHKNRLVLGDELSLASCHLRDRATGESYDLLEGRQEPATLRKIYAQLSQRILNKRE
ncbi:MAG: hypothetical protein ONB48_12590 [candidate division KSB1 bacterium]|nr:hypothetical protein [candidate division KSB1 bacterium]MDZ7275068.1 hypothetical protein [candidate division KSB1 bacterium]MDZ7286484.1 hypothetical protein [candidate division KSB1 bacterium]MDZ7299352.1 hypothetical protein [candidate division KSB1 bacterium]MDZ7306319.1 hypothetical protein [candidate division KSB1 bacterium]